MSSLPVNKTLWRRRDSGHESVELPDVILRTESQGDLADPGMVVAEAEARVAITARPNAVCSKRTRANQLHQEADQLYYKGDYESALVLYHRAARLCPREHSHSVAAWRIQAAISSAANPSEELSKQLKDARSSSQISALLSSEVAAKRAQDVVAESLDPFRDIPKVLRFVESRKDFWRLMNLSNSKQRNHSKVMLNQLNRCMVSTFKELESAYEAGDSATVHELGDVLLNLASVSEEPEHNQLNLFSYLANRQIILKRHDRAVNLAVKMIFLARTRGNTVWMTEALVIIGKVHLAFGHLDALVKVWERLAENLEPEALPQAWLYHDIGRCHLEIGNFEKALNAVKLCLVCANSVQSKKWIIRGYLLNGQILLQQRKFAEAVIALKTAAITALEEEDDGEQMIIHYVQNLIDQVTSLLKKINKEHDNKDDMRKSITDLEELKSPTNSIAETHGREQIEHLEIKSNCGNLAKDERSPPKQRKRYYRGRPRLESQEDTSDEEKVAQLLEKTRALRSVRPALSITGLRDKGSKAQRSSGTICERLSVNSSEANDNDGANASVDLESSRTRIIRRCESDRNSDEDRTLKADDLFLLSDISCTDDMVEDDFGSMKFEDGDISDADKEEAIQSGVNSLNTLRTAQAIVPEEANEKSVSYFSPDEEQTSPSVSFSMDSESGASPTSEHQSEYFMSMMNYVKNMKSCDFDKIRRKIKEENIYEETVRGLDPR